MYAINRHKIEGRLTLLAVCASKAEAAVTLVGARTGDTRSAVLTRLRHAGARPRALADICRVHHRSHQLKIQPRHLDLSSHSYVTFIM